MDKWISVKDRLPDPEVDVLVWLKKSECKQAIATAGLFYEDDHLVWMGWEDEQPFMSYWEVTHWMPAINPPGYITQPTTIQPTTP